MSGKHTPGPWSIVSDETVTVRDVGDGCIASCGWLTGRFTGPRRSSVEVHANARLIASAPEMLEALEDAQAALSNAIHLHGEVAPWRFALDQVRAAIAKAEGQS